MTASSPSLGEALAAGVRGARDRLGDPLAPVAIVSSSRTTSEQLARSLAAHGGALGVSLLTATQVISDIGRPLMLERGWFPEPAGWLAALLSDAVPRLAAAGELGAHGDTLCQPGWRASLASTLSELEAAGVAAEALGGPGLPALRGSEPLQERAHLLARLLREIEDQRRQERIYSGRQLEQAALEHLQAGRPHLHQRVRAVVVVGDTLLSPARCEALRAFFGSRDATRVRLPPLDNLPPAPHGLRIAAEGAREIEVLPAETGVGHLRRRLFAAELSAGPADDTVELVATPDEVRELEEAARAVLSAIRGGVALDRIAVVLPDPSQAEALEQALARARIPATWLTAPPLARALPARFLLLALEMAQAGGTPARWYHLLTQPGLEGLVRSGSRRWRGLFAAAPADPRRIEPWLDRLAEAQEDPKQAEAARVLRDNVRHVQAQLDALPRRARLGEHARAWRTLLAQLWAPDRDRARVMRALDAWGSETAGVFVPLEAAAALLREHLAATPDLRGSLTQRRVRVLPPMLALGGEYDLVCVTGLTEGRFPRRVEEGVLLTEELRLALVERGFPLVDLAARREVERRRLAAVAAGCRGRLWLSAPRAELLEGRPLLPSALLLDVASTLAGRRVSFSELPLRPQGRRSLPVPAPADALDPAQRLIALSIFSPEQAIADLAARRPTRRLLQLHRSIDRLYSGEALPDAWTGLVDPALLPLEALEGEPLTPAALADLVLAPSAFFFRYLLAAYPASALPSGARMSWRELRRRAMDVLREVACEADVEAAFTARWRQSVEAWAAAEGGLEEGELPLLLELGRRQLEILQRAGAARLDGQLTAVGRIHPSLPLQVAVQAAAVQGSDLLIWSSAADPLKAQDRRSLQLLAQGLALQGAGHAVAAVRRVSLDGEARAADLASARPEVEGLVADAYDRARRGWWPALQADDRFALGRERRASLDWAALHRRLKEQE